MTVGGRPNLHVAVAIALGRQPAARDGELVAVLYQRLGRTPPARARGPLRDQLAAALDRPASDTDGHLVDVLYRQLARPPAPAPPLSLFDFALPAREAS